MLTCPNASRHPSPSEGRFFTPAVVLVGPEWDVLGFREFLAPDAVCAVCFAQAEDVPEES